MEQLSQLGFLHIYISPCKIKAASFTLAKLILAWEGDTGTRCLKDVFISRVAPPKRQKYFTFKTPATCLTGIYANKNVVCTLGK